MDVSGISLIVQYRAAHLDLNTLIQRFGRGGRDLRSDVRCILFAEKEFTDEDRQRRAEIAAEKAATKARSRIPDLGGNAVGANKRKRKDQGTEANKRARSSMAQHRDASTAQPSHSGALAQPTPTGHPPAIIVDPPPISTSDLRERLLDPRDSGLPTSLRSTPKDDTVDAAIDEFINAGKPGRAKERRIVVNIMYGNADLR
jgi:superfamily II DNA/RNA helicase